MKWKIFKGREHFSSNRAKWDALNSSIDDHILLDSNFWEPLVQVFGHDELYVGMCENSEYPAMILVEHVGPGQWRTFQPSQAPLGPLLLANPTKLDEQLQGLLKSFPGLALSLGITQQDPQYSVIQPGGTHPQLEFLDYITTPRIPLLGAFDSYWKQRGKDLSGNLVRRKRRLQEQGIQMSLAIIHKSEDIHEAIRVYGQFEASGWKGTEGTAVHVENDQGRFYREMLMRFCDRDEGMVFQLLMNEEPIASNLCVKRNGMLVLLKTAYNEQYKKLSPSYILLEEMLKRLFQDESIESLEFYGRSKEWHKKWTEDERTMYHVNIYRSAMISEGRKFLKRRILSSKEKV